VPPSRPRTYKMSRAKDARDPAASRFHSIFSRAVRAGSRRPACHGIVISSARDAFRLPILRSKELRLRQSQPRPRHHLSGRATDKGDSASGESRLLTFPNVIVTSHMAYFTDHALAEIAACVLQILSEFEQGQALVNRVV